MHDIVQFMYIEVNIIRIIVQNLNTSTTLIYN
jgi:hypothetical protein